MRDFLTFLKWALVVIAFLAILGFVLNAIGFGSYVFWAPKRENARTEVFRNTDAFVGGKQQYLTRLHLEWTQADSSGRGVICATARHEASTLDPEHVPATLSDWECIR